MENFQSQSKKSGDAFEELVYADLVSRGFGPIDRNYCFENVGCEVDFRAHSKTTFEYIEAKGGLSGEGKRPGAQRTDNVKKAIANGALIKTSNRFTLAKLSSLTAPINCDKLKLAFAISISSLSLSRPLAC